MGGWFSNRPPIGARMIYFKSKEGNILGKKSPSKEQVEFYKKEGYVECDENGKVATKAPKAKKK
tara:strand:- start:807 stop:998 length:192 start_codon:yes stop_codon:yes gene_type:complete